MVADSTQLEVNLTPPRREIATYANPVCYVVDVDSCHVG
jgi:hypothetical protein